MKDAVRVMNQFVNLSKTAAALKELTPEVRGGEDQAYFWQLPHAIVFRVAVHHSALMRGGGGGGVKRGAGWEGQIELDWRAIG